MNGQLSRRATHKTSLSSSRQMGSKRAKIDRRSGGPRWRERERERERNSNKMTLACSLCLPGHGLLLAAAPLLSPSAQWWVKLKLVLRDREFPRG